MTDGQMVVALVWTQHAWFNNGADSEAFPSVDAALEAAGRYVANLDEIEVVGVEELGPDGFTMVDDWKRRSIDAYEPPPPAEPKLIKPWRLAVAAPRPASGGTQDEHIDSFDTEAEAEVQAVVLRQLFGPNRVRLEEFCPSCYARAPHHVANCTWRER